MGNICFSRHKNLVRERVELPSLTEKITFHTEQEDIEFLDIEL